MDYHKLIIVLILISVLLGILLVVQILQKKKVFSPGFGHLSLRCSVNLSKEASAHVVEYGNFSFLITASKNGSASALPLFETTEMAENSSDFTGTQQ